MTTIKKLIVEDILAKRLITSAGLMSRKEFENLITEKYGSIPLPYSTKVVALEMCSDASQSYIYNMWAM